MDNNSADEIPENYVIERLADDRTLTALLNGFQNLSQRWDMARAAGLREMESAFRRRCSRAAEHSDHFYPWSKGGSTSLQNFVAACAKCNRGKGARIPSPGQQERIERRRRNYVLPDGSVSVGERQPLP